MVVSKIFFDAHGFGGYRVTLQEINISHRKGTWGSSENQSTQNGLFRGYVTLPGGYPTISPKMKHRLLNDGLLQDDFFKFQGVYSQVLNWVVVSNMFLFSALKLWKMNPSWRAYFSNGLKRWNHQLVSHMKGGDPISDTPHVQLSSFWFFFAPFFWVLGEQQEQVDLT